jgi:hypothetical protein
MNAKNPTATDCAALEQTIERQILQRTWGFLHHVRVDVREDRVVVHGYTSRYYHKQLAIQAALEALRFRDPVPVELDIIVGTNDQWGRSPSERFHGASLRSLLTIDGGERSQTQG